jgi:hypothetical protein
MRNQPLNERFRTMNRRAIPVAAVLLTLAALPAAWAGTGSDSPDTYEAALARSAETGQPVVLDFFTEW